MLSNTLDGPAYLELPKHQERRCLQQGPWRPSHGLLGGHHAGTPGRQAADSSPGSLGTLSRCPVRGNAGSTRNLPAVQINGVCMAAHHKVHTTANGQA